MKIFVLMLKQDDPKKCTAAKLTKFQIVEPIKFIPNNAIILNPFSNNILSKNDRYNGKSLLAIDCSWNNIQPTFNKFRKTQKGINRRLPFLLAGNPVNYAKLGKLTTVEALAGSLFILGYSAEAENLLSKFRWGHTFLELNLELLNLYSNKTNPLDIIKTEQEYFPNLF